MQTDFTISRTTGNVYEKVDKASWMLYPRNDKYIRKHSTFVDVFDLIISENEPEINIEEINVMESILKIKHNLLTTIYEEKKEKQKVKK